MWCRNVRRLHIRAQSVRTLSARAQQIHCNTEQRKTKIRAAIMKTIITTVIQMRKVLINMITKVRESNKRSRTVLARMMMRRPPQIAIEIPTGVTHGRRTNNCEA